MVQARTDAIKGTFRKFALVWRETALNERRGQPIELFTGDQRIIMDPSWQEPGQVCIRQDYPLPAEVLGIIPEIVIGDTKSP